MAGKHKHKTAKNKKEIKNTNENDRAVGREPALGGAETADHRA